jgi:adenylylsulfate kinase
MIAILVLWAVPRSTSTAFERMMSQRGDHTCVHEPFGEVWYSIGNDTHPPDAHIQHRPELDYESVWEDLVSQARQGPVFMKDFPHYVTHMHNWAAPAGAIDGEDLPFLDAFNHSFLIRDPAKTLTSMYGQWTDFNLAETGFAEQRHLFDLLTERLGSPPPLIDADDLLDAPERVTSAWCEAVGIDPRPEALEWGASQASELTWYESGTWHNNLAQSTTLARQKRDYVSIDHNQYLRDMHEACLPHYEAMHLHRISG